MTRRVLGSGCPIVSWNTHTENIRGQTTYDKSVPTAYGRQKIVFSSSTGLRWTVCLKICFPNPPVAYVIVIQAFNKTENHTSREMSFMTTISFNRILASKSGPSRQPRSQESRVQVHDLQDMPYLSFKAAGETFTMKIWNLRSIMPSFLKKSYPNLWKTWISASAAARAETWKVKLQTALGRG